MEAHVSRIPDPENYFTGVGDSELPTPRRVLLFVRRDRSSLQREELRNRSHHRFVLVCNLRTPGLVHVEHLTLSFQPGQALVIHPHQFHHYSHLATHDLQWLFCTFELDYPGFLEPLRNHVVPLADSSRDALGGLLESWSHPGSELQAQVVQTDLLNLLLHLKTDWQASMTAPPVDATDNLLRDVNRLLTEWKGRPVGVGDVARALAASPSHLRARFRELAGVPLGRYLLNYRVTHAMALLRTTNRSIADVADEAGFGSPQAFSRMFKKETGQTPRAYRNSVPLS